MATTIDATAISTQTSGYITRLKSDLDSKIAELEDETKQATAYSDYPAIWQDLVLEDLYAITDRATDLIENIQFDKVETRELMPDVGSAEKTHTWVTPQMETLENNLISMLGGFGDSEFKSMAGISVPQTVIDTIAAERSVAEGRASRLTSILNRYPTPDTQGCIDWISERFGFHETDSTRNLYMTMFAIAQEQAQWATGNITEIESLHADFTSSYNSLLFGMVKANIAAYHGEVDANIAKLRNEIMVQEAKIDVEVIKADTSLTEADLKVKQRNARVAAYVKNYGSSMSKTIYSLDMRVSASKALAESYRAILAAYASRYSAVVIGRQ